MSEIKKCDKCKTGFPVKYFIQQEGYYELYCEPCGKERYLKSQVEQWIDAEDHSADALEAA